MYLTDFINLSPVIHAPVCMHVGIIIWNVNTTIAEVLKACTRTMYKKVITWRSSLPSNKCEQNMNISDYVMNCINQSRMPELRLLVQKLLHKPTALSHCQQIQVRISEALVVRFNIFPYTFFSNDYYNYYCSHLHCIYLPCARFIYLIVSSLPYFSFLFFTSRSSHSLTDIC